VPIEAPPQHPEQMREAIELLRKQLRGE